MDETVAYLKAITSAEWTTRLVLEAGRDSHLQMHAILPKNTRLRAGNKSAHSFDMVKLSSHNLGYLLKHNFVVVRFSQDITPDTINHPKDSIVITYNTVKDCKFIVANLRVADTDLRQFVNSLTIKLALLETGPSSASVPPSEAFEGEEKQNTRSKGAKWTDAQLQALVADSDAGKSQADLAEVHGLSRQRISVLLRDARSEFGIRAKSDLASNPLATLVKHQVSRK